MKITQWSTPGHIGADNIHESNGACVMWGFHDSYGFGGDDLGTSVLAMEWVENTYSDLAGADTNSPYERIDGMKPVNNHYNASVGSLMGMGMPAMVSSLKISVR